MQPIKTTILILVFLLIIVPVVLTFGITYIPSLHQPSLVGTQKIDELESVSQSFIEENNNLAEVALTLKNPDLKNKQDIIFNLYNPEGELLRTVVRNGSSILDGDFVKFQFAPIPDSRGQSYTFMLSAPKVNINNALETYISPQSREGEILKVNDKVATGSASFATFSKVPNRLYVLKLVIGGVLSKLLGDPVFAGAYVLIVLVCLGYLIKGSIKRF